MAPASEFCEYSVFFRGLLLREPHCGADFLLNTVRPPVSVSLSCAVFRLLLNASRPLYLSSLREASRAGCWLPEARLSFHAPSQARHWLKIRTIMFWTLRCCDIFWNICSRLLLCRTGLLRELFVLVVKDTRPACCWLCSFFMGSRVQIPGSLFMGPWVPIRGCFTFFTAVWHVFHPTFCWSTSFMDVNVNFPFRITVADQSIESAHFITGFWIAFKLIVKIRLQRFPHISECPLLCQRSESACTLQLVPPYDFHRGSSRHTYRLDATFNVMSYPESEVTCLVSHTATYHAQHQGTLICVFNSTLKRGRASHHVPSLLL